MNKFKKFVYTPAGFNDATLAIAACRAGGIGILNAELGMDLDLIISQLDFISRKTTGEYGLKLDILNDCSMDRIVGYTQKGLRWLILDAEVVPVCQEWIAEFKKRGVRVFAEVKTAGWPERPLNDVVDGLILKGNEAGGFVGGNGSFVLLQKWRAQTQLPLLIRGGVTPYVAAACSAMGVIGGILDSQVLLLDESPLSQTLLPVLGNLMGNETVAVGDEEKGAFFRLLVRPGHRAAQAFYAEGDGQKIEILKRLVQDKVNWKDPANGLLPVGQDVCFAGLWRKQYGHMANVFEAIDSVVGSSLRQVVAGRAPSENAPLAESLGIPLPVVQGPMTRVSDNIDFAKAVSRGGALPTMALALLKGPALNQLMKKTAEAFGNTPWAIGLLGFVPEALFDEQLAAAKKYRPGYAIIAGGRPDQAMKLEKAGIHAFLHVPSANLLSLFLQEGVRRFIFEGRECGGHIGPLSSFVLWSMMVDRLLSESGNGKISAEDIHVLFAGGIHDAFSSAIVQVLAAPLVNKGVKIGILMGSSYLFTKEIVDSGALLSTFQKLAIDCERTVCLQSGPGHASRCAISPFVKAFFQKCSELRERKIPANERREILDGMIMGRLHLASRGCFRESDDCELKTFDANYQKSEGMYMLGEVGTLRKGVTDIPSLHREVTADASNLLSARFGEITQAKERPAAKPVDVAIIGMACLLPKANTIHDYWHNIIGKIVAVTEIPPHRWDWRLYYDKDRRAKDKIYSKWGGFIDDLAFDPTLYGIPPKSIESVDPMQLMALEVVRRTLVDAGYEQREFDRLRTSVIIGASGGVGDVGMQYGLRSELPRFQGHLPESIARRLPEWTEDTFAGILPNVIAGRIANRLDFGGVNFTTDAACASSLAAMYQAITELTTGRSNFVIAGGVDTVQGPFGYMCFGTTQALSPQGRCRTFNASADGIVISEGIAMVALKRLQDAERDGDRIYAVIKGVGASSDGRAKGLAAPEPAGQLRAMQRAYDQAGFGPDTLGLYEAHGTGTVAGDMAELESTTQLLKNSESISRQTAVSSVKTLIGHTKATAGVAGLIKASLALHHRVLPPHFPVEQPIQILQQEDSPLFLLDEALPWLAINSEPRRAGCSAFGFGGTNFHLVLEEYTGEYRPWMHSAVSQRWPAELLLWTGADGEDLVAKLAPIHQGLGSATHIELRDLAFNLARNYRPGRQTLAIVAADCNDLRDKIRIALSYLKGDNAGLPRGIYYSAGGESDGKVAVLFPGQGSQYTAMFRELALYFPVINQALSMADELLSGCFAERFGANMRLSRFIFPRGTYNEQSKKDATRALNSTDVAQPALGAVEAGLWELMRTLGLSPDMLGGHSYGEFVALFAGGYIDFRTLMSLSEARGRFIVDAAKNSGAQLGAMAAVLAPREDVEKAISGIDDVIVANINAPQQNVISGSTSALHEALEKFAKAGIIAREIPVAAAFHSRLVAPAQTALADLIMKTDWQEDGVRIPVYSNTTAERHAKDIQQTKRIMIDHLVKPVEFMAEIEAMYRDGARVFLELGPKAVLTGLISSILGDASPHKAIAVDAKGGAISGMLEAIGQLLCAGVKLDILKLFEGRHCIDGDPADLTQMQREAPPPKHVWMLNGSGARRFDEPVRPFGIQMDAPGAALTQEPQNKVIQPIAPQKISTARTAMMPIKNRKEEPQMRRREQAPHRRDPSVMAEYFDTMRLFLETQQSVMSMYMGVASTRRSTSTWPQRAIQTRALNKRAESEAGRTPQQSVLPDQREIPAKAFVETPAQPDEPSLPDGQKKTTPAAARLENTTAGLVQAETSSQNFDEQKIAGILLSIVEEKTGYPKDIVSLDQNLEAELGIDSIKRVEIVGALLKVLPQRFKESLDGDQGKLNTQPNLKGMVDLLLKVEREGSGPVPFEQTGVGSNTCKSSGSLRYVIVSKPESTDPSAVRRLEKGHFILTQDRLEVARELSELLDARGCTVHIVTRDVLMDEKLLDKWCASMEKDLDAVSGVVHLAQIGSDRIREDATPESWRRQLQLNEKSLFILLHNFSDKLREGAHVLSASALGGFFNREGDIGLGLPLQGGAVGLLKSLYQERPALRVKAVDVDPGQKSGSIARDLLSELELAGGRQEVGYPDGRRTIFQTVPAPVGTGEGGLEKIQNIVVLATGGLKGVTAEVLREFALPGNTLLLTGRSPLPEPEPEELQSLETPLALRQHFISQVRNGRLQLTPAKIRSKVQSILAAREMRYNIEDFRKRGAAVEYFPVDVTDHDGMQALLHQIYDRYDKIDGVLHGAGIIEDKLLADKSSDSWSRVVETKVLGLLLLQRYLRPESLKFFSVFSSVAGRYGNSGQTDYATANELMNRLCCQLNTHWSQKVRVKAFCWGPWSQTKLGTGMVTEYTEAKFAEIGVKLVGLEDGCRLFKEEMIYADDNHVEIICGEGPWEQQEAAVGRIERHIKAVADNFSAPLLHNATLKTLPKGNQIITILLGDTHAYLKEHRIDDIPVLPAAAALEIMSEAAAHLWPGWIVAEVRDCRLLKGVELKAQELKLNLIINPPIYGSSDSFEVNVAVQTEQGDGRNRIHYRSVLRLTQQLPPGFEHRPKLFSEKQLTAAEAYNQWLFHGPRFQVIEKINGLSEGGVNALVRTTRPAQWLINVETNPNQWVFDPALVDAAAQMAIIWCRAFRNETSLPVGFGRVIRCTDTLPDKLHMHFDRLPSEEPHLIRANVYFTDTDNQVVLMIEDMECVSSAALNRVGGAPEIGFDSTASNLLAKEA